MDFGFSQRVKDYQQRLTAFMDEHVYPNEPRYHREIEGERMAPRPGHRGAEGQGPRSGLWNLFLPEPNTAPA